MKNPLDMKNIYLLFLVLLVQSAVLFGQSRVYPPTLKLPENGAVDQMPNVELDWDAVTGENLEIYYEVQIAEDTNFTNPITFPLTLVTALNASELNFGDTYFWRVRAHDGNEVSDWSEMWSFTVLSTVTIVDPTDGLEVTPQVDIEWEMVDGATSYDLLVDTLFIWKKINVPFTSNVRSVFVYDENICGGVGEDGLVFHKEGSDWVVEDIGTTKDLYNLHIVTPSSVWVIGKSGTAIHFDGNSWTDFDLGTTKDLYGIYFIDDNNGWVVGKSGKAFYFDGTTWNALDLGTTKDLYAVWALSPNDVWVVGKSGTFVHYDGTSWTVSTPGTKDYLNLWFNSANDGWAVGKSGRYAHWNGSSWEEENIGLSKILYDVAFKSADEGYIVGQSGVLFQYDGNGGWKKITSGTTNVIYSVSFAGDKGLYGGKNGVLYTYTGGGFNSPYAHIYHMNGDVHSYYLANLLFGKTYYYKMRAAHSVDTSDWSDARSFIIQSTPVLLSPSDGATDQQLKVELDWKDFEGVLKYNVTIADNPEFNNAFNSSTDSSSTFVTGLSFGKDYYWKVNAQHAEATSPWTEPWHFTTVNTVELDSPSDGQTDVDPCPMLKWNIIEGAASYEVWLDTVNTFATAMVRVETSDHSQCQVPLLKGKTYYWKVRAIVALDTSDFSPVWSFTTKAPEGIEEETIENSLSIYPNPSDGRFVLSMQALKGRNIDLVLYDVAGKEVYQKQVLVRKGSNDLMIDLGELSSGIYYLNIRNANLSITRKITIR